MTTPQITTPSAPPDPLAPQPTFRATFYAYLQSLITAFDEANAGFTWTAEQLALVDAARDLAENYAQREEDSAIPEVGGYSALHYAAKAAAERVQTGLDRTATGEDLVQTGLDVIAANLAAALAGAATGVDLDGTTVGDVFAVEDDGAGGKRLGTTTLPEIIQPGLIPLAKQEVTTPVAALEFSLPGGYAAYQIRIKGLVPVNATDTLMMRTSSNDGSSFDTSSNYAFQGVRTRIAGATNDTESASTDKFIISGEAISGGAGATGYNAVIDLDNCGSAAKTSYMLRAVYTSSTEGGHFWQVGYRTTADLTDALQLYCFTDDIESCEVHIYGIVEGDT